VTKSKMRTNSLIATVVYLLVSIAAVTTQKYLHYSNSSNFATDLLFCVRVQIWDFIKSVAVIEQGLYRHHHRYNCHE
jgi:hypothetical protein